MAVNDLITALNYNNIYNAVNPVIGRQTNGYGRAMLSSTVAGGSTQLVTSQQQRELYLDMEAGYVHQNNAVSAAAVTDLGRVDVGDSIDWADITTWQSLQGLVTGFDDSSPFNFPEASFSVDFMRTAYPSGTTMVSTKAGNTWGSTVDIISHRITITFQNQNFRNWYLNAGGLIRFNASATGGTSGTATTKDGDWARILSAMGTLSVGRKQNGNWVCYSSGSASLSYDSATMSGNSTVSGGFLTAGTTVYSINGGFFNPTFGQNIYSNNQFRLVMVVPNNQQIILEAVFDDSDQGTGGQVEGYVPGRIDENVTADISSEFRVRYPDSEFTITEGGTPTTYDAVKLDPPTGAADKLL